MHNQLNKTLFNKYGIAILGTLVILSFLFDSINFVIDVNSGLTFDNSVSYYFKGIVELSMIVLLLRRKDNYKILSAILLFITLPVLSYFTFVTLSEGDIDLSYLFQIFKESNKYIYVVIIYLTIRGLSLTDRSFITFEIIYLLSAGIVFFAILFDIDIFYTYGINRFGFKPPMAPQNDITFFWMIGAFYFFCKWLIERRNVALLKLIIILIASALLGTKAIILFLLCLFCFYVIYVYKPKVVGKKFIFPIGVIVLILFIYFSGSYEFYEEVFKNEGLLYVITSKRNVLFAERIPNIIEEWSLINYFIGGTFSKVPPITEMDLVDLYIFVGLFGCLIYGYILYKTVFLYKKRNIPGWFFVLQFLLIGSLAGHVFASGINAIYLALLCVFLQNNEDLFEKQLFNAKNVL